MKIHITPLLVSFFVILTSLSECDPEALIITTRYAPVSAELNGVLFTSDSVTYLWNSSAADLFKYEDSFTFGFNRDISSSDTSEVSIGIILFEETPFELNREYSLGTKDDEKYGQIRFFTDDGGSYRFISSEGHIVFTKCSGTGPHSVSGYFEFTAVDSSNDSTIIVTNGTFENLRTNDY